VVDDSVAAWPFNHVRAMNHGAQILAWFWWLYVGSVPFQMAEANALVALALGCTSLGNCYPPPSNPFYEAASALEHMEPLAWLLLFPVSAWFVIYRPLRALAGAVKRKNILGKK
jgi:hypothetical protein